MRNPDPSLISAQTFLQLETRGDFMDLLRKVSPQSLNENLSSNPSAMPAPTQATTILAFKYKDGVIVAADRRATAGNFIGLPQGGILAGRTTFVKPGLIDLTLDGARIAGPLRNDVDFMIAAQDPFVNVERGRRGREAEQNEREQPETGVRLH